MDASYLAERVAAITGYNAALEVITRDAFPRAWASTQVNRATVSTPEPADRKI